MDQWNLAIFKKNILNINLIIREGVSVFVYRLKQFFGFDVHRYFCPSWKLTGRQEEMVL